MMRRFFVLSVMASLLPVFAVAQGTKLWTVSRYEEMERGTTDGVAIRSDGRIEAGPATSLLYSTGGNYVWAVASGCFQYPCATLGPATQTSPISSGAQRLVVFGLTITIS